MESMPVQEQSVIEGWRGVLVAAGLRTPSQRALTMFLASGAVAYALKYPRESFRPDGTMRPARIMGSQDGDATDSHFLLTPLALSTIVFLFT